MFVFNRNKSVSCIIRLQQLVLIFALLLVVSNLFATEEANDFSIDLIHRDSPLSPSYNSSMTRREILIRAALRSIARSKRFARSSHLPTIGESKAAETLITLGVADYLMKIFIGSPPREQWVVGDTGSSLTWVQCEPCTHCYKQDAQIFNPKNSSTYVGLMCYAPVCESFKEDFTSCGEPLNYCRFELSYADKSKTIGELAFENVGFSADISSGTKLVVMGCRRDNTGLFGIGGLGASNLSLVSQFGDQNGLMFSYCLTSSLFSNKTGKLTFQSNSTILTGSPNLVSIPLSIQDKEYYTVILEAISINRDYENQVYPRVRSMTIDSGSTLTLLDPELYDELEAMVINSIPEACMDDPPLPFSLCYEEVLDDVLDLNFHFEGDAIVQFLPDNMFTTTGDEDLYCLTIIRSPEGEKPILGNTAQVDYKVEFDLIGKKVTFDPTT
ncbi:hypothetical protein OROGR_013960 [Orobanche gracilis]